MTYVRLVNPLQVGELGIREYTMADLDSFHAGVLRNREYLVPCLRDWVKAEPLTIEQRRDIFLEWTNTYDQHSHPIGIFVNDEFVGSTGLSATDEPGEVEIGYWVDQAHQGKGIATRSTRALSDWALAQPEIHKVILIHKIGNDGSFQVAQKSGFTQEETFQECNGSPAIRWVKTK